MLKIAIIGAGLIGRKRGIAALADGDTFVETIVDTNLGSAQKLAGELRAPKVASDWREALDSKDVNAVIITTPNHLHAPIAIQSLRSNKHVLCEKPLTTSIIDANEMIQIATNAGLVLKTGFNHRHFPHIDRAKKICDEGTIGDLYYIRCHYGHGGRKGYDAEWRGDVKLAGGGELMDQGIHVVDLCRWFLGDFSETQGFVRSYHWGSNTIEDNAFFSMSTSCKQVAHAHVSWTQWKNSFLFEVFGSKGYIKLRGLTGYYGAPTLVLGVRTPNSVVPQESTFEFLSDDISFIEEWKVFKKAIEGKTPVLADGRDGLEALRLVLSIYESNRIGGCI